MNEGRYQDVLPLASGGMGSVSLCVLTAGEGFERVCAIKRMHPQLADDADFRAMFVREAQLAGAIRHGNVVAVLDVQEGDSGPFLVMEYVEGLSLAAIIPVVGDAMPLQVGLRILRDACRGLAAAHTAVDHDGVPLEIIHRDVSPGNVLVGFDGAARLSDFGVAKATRVFSKTATGIFKGKLGYAAPEMLLFQAVDARADLFSFGVVAFETLTGSRLYSGEQGPRRLVHDPPPDLLDYRDVPDELSNLIFRLLAKSPADRPTSASEVAKLLDELVAEEVSREGVLSIEAFMEEHFAAERRERQQALEQGIRAVRAARSSPAVADAGTPQPPTLRRRVAAVVVVTLAAAALIGGLLALGVSPSPEVERADPTFTAPPAAPPPPPEETANEVTPLVQTDPEPAATAAQERAAPPERSRSSMRPSQSRVRVGGHEPVPF